MKIDKVKMFMQTCRSTQEEILAGDRIWVSFDCGYGQELVSYTKEALIHSLNSDTHDSKGKPRSGVYTEPFGDFTRNLRWFDNYYECKLYTTDMQIAKQEKESA